MQAFEQRPLTAGEIGLARSLFGDGVDWKRVCVRQAPPLPGLAAFVPLGRAIVFSRWRARRDFSDADILEQGWFAHELAHVWQAERGVVLALAKLKALSARAYRYQPGKAFAAYNIEQQAEIVRHLFLARAGEPAAGAPARAWLEEVWREASR